MVQTTRPSRNRPDNPARQSDNLRRETRGRLLGADYVPLSGLSRQVFSAISLSSGASRARTSEADQ